MVARSSLTLQTSAGAPSGRVTSNWYVWAMSSFDPKTSPPGFSKVALLPSPIPSPKTLTTNSRVPAGTRK